VAALGLGVVAIVISVLAGEGFNVSLLVGLAFAVAASSNLPALVFALFWKRFNTTGAVAGGLLSSLVLIALSPAVWPGPDGEGSPIPLTNPAIVSIPFGILCSVLGTLLSRERAAERTYHELHVRAETGLGAERTATAH
jgi:cation/acetate symporter